MNRLDRAAIRIVNAVGTMWCAILFAALALVALPSAAHNGTLAIVSWISQTFIQLVMLSIIMVGQRLSEQTAKERHTETVAHTGHLHMRLTSLHADVEQATQAQSKSYRAQESSETKPEKAAQTQSSTKPRTRRNPSTNR